MALARLDGEELVEPHHGQRAQHAVVGLEQDQLLRAVRHVAVVQLHDAGEEGRADDADVRQVDDHFLEGPRMLDDDRLGPILMQVADVEFLADGDGQPRTRGPDVIGTQGVGSVHDRTRPSRQGWAGQA
jgi:hypothetical protein